MEDVEVKKAKYVKNLKPENLFLRLTLKLKV